MCKFSMESHFFPGQSAWQTYANAYREWNKNDSAAFIFFNHICYLFALPLIIIICIYRIYTLYTHTHKHNIMQFVFNHPAHTLVQRARINSCFFFVNVCDVFMHACLSLSWCGFSLVSSLASNAFHLRMCALYIDNVHLIIFQRSDPSNNNITIIWKCLCVCVCDSTVAVAIAFCQPLFYGLILFDIKCINGKSTYIIHKNIYFWSRAFVMRLYCVYCVYMLSVCCFAYNGNEMMK